MPTSGRKSSVGGARRGPQKAHIPYRGDNPNVGKKTGIAVQHVERKSDGFEPFDEVIGQADGRTPPRPKGKKKKSIPKYFEDDDDDDDEYGEMSMEVDSPLQNVANLRAPVTPTNGRSSRPVARTSSIDFDKIPSPRGRNMHHGAAGPSRLRRSIIPEEREPSSEPHERYDEEASGMNLNAGGYDDAPLRSDSPQQTSFTQIDQDDYDDVNDEPEDEPDTSKRNKGKGRVRQEEVDEDEDVEDEIARRLNNLDHAQHSDEDEPEPEPKKKKIKISEQEPPRQKVTKTKSTMKKENRPIRDGVRRSTREHYKPLEYWRGEKVVYGRPDFAQPVLVPHIREIIRIPKEQPEPIHSKRKRARSRSRTVQPPPVPVEVINPEEGWDDDTEPNAKVLEYRNGEEVEKRIAWTAQMVDPKRVPNGDWAYEKILWDSDFIAAGQLVIPPKCRKPSKATKDNTYIFYVIEGAVNLKIHDTSLVLTSGGMFMIPRGNTYFIENISQRSAKLFFTQARKAMNDEEERAVAIANNNARQKRKARRSSSAGPLSGRAESTAAPQNGDSTPVAPRAKSTKI